MSDISKIKVGETTYDIKDQAGREAFANSKVSVLDSTSDTDHIPTAKAVYDYGQSIKNSIASNASGVDTLARALLGHGRTKISVFSNSDYTNVQSNSSLSPWFENYYKKVDSYVSVSGGSRGLSHSHYITAMEITMGEPSSMGSSYTSTIEKGLVKQTYVYNSGNYYYTYSVDMSGTSIPVAIQLTNQITVTIDGVTYYYPQGMYFYNNISEQKFVYSVVAYYDGLDTFRTALSNFDSRTTALEDAINNQSGSGEKTASRYNLGDYYAVKTIHVSTDLLSEEEGDWFDELVRVSDYTDINSLFYLYAEIEGTVYQEINSVFDAGIMEDFPFKAYVFPCQIPFYVMPEDFTYEKEIQDPSTGETTIQSTTCRAGLYCPPVDIIISVLEKKEKYLVQKSYDFVPSGEAVLQQFFKVSDDIDIDGLYSALAISDLKVSSNDFSIYLDYTSGGHFKSLQESNLGLPISTIYCLEGSYYAGSCSAMVVTEETTLPENLGGITVAPGTYLGVYQSGETILPYMKLVKLQEKEVILDIDELLGEYAEGVSILEALLGGVETSPTGEFSIEMHGDLENRVGQYSMQIFDIMKTAFENKGEVIFRLSASNGYVDFKLKPHINKYMGTYVGVVSGSMFMEAWMDISLELVSYQSGVELYCKIKVYLPEQS